MKTHNERAFEETKRGVLDVLRHGLKFYGKLVRVAPSPPPTG